MYKTITYGDICEGSYIVLKQYRLESAKKLVREGRVMLGTHYITRWQSLTCHRYVVLEDFYSIGQDQRPPMANDTFAYGVADRARNLHRTATVSPIHSADLDRLAGSARRTKVLVSGGTSDKCHEIQQAELEEGSDMAPTLPISLSPSATTSVQKKRKLDIALGEIDPNFGSISESPSKRVKDRQRSSPLKDSFSNPQSWLPNPSDRGICLQQMTTDSLENRDVFSTMLLGEKHRSTSESAGWVPLHSASSASLVREDRAGPLQIDRPLNVQPLAKFRGYHRRNDVYDVFVVVQWVGESVIKRPRMPPKRDLRIVDPSTGKKVLLSVFVEPERFTPTIGTVALIRSVTTHEWDGGMLNVYPKQCEGRQWFIPSPIGLEGCDVETMREWWKETQAKECEKRPAG